MSTLAQLASNLQAEGFSSLPIIDLESSRGAEVISQEIKSACLNAGFFFVQNHGVDRSIIDCAFQAAESLFSQSKDVKASIDISKSDNFRGYMGLLTENNDPTKKGELHEAFNLGLDPSLYPSSFVPSAQESSPTEDKGLVHSDNIWPDKAYWEQADQFKRATLEYYSALLKLGQSLFPLFARALDLPADFFDDKIKHPAAIMRLLHYPGIPIEERDEMVPGIGAHTDFECFTILAQGDVQALQVQNRKGEWIDAPCIDNAFVINIGDQFARWTNDIFLSTPHRVLPPTRTRYSIPFFFGCDHDVPLNPPPTCGPPKPEYLPIMTAGAYVAMRLNETYTVKRDESPVSIVVS